MKVKKYRNKGEKSKRGINSQIAIAIWLIILGYFVKGSGYSSNFNCSVSGLNANANSNGNVNANDDAGSNCNVNNDGNSNCELG